MLSYAFCLLFSGLAIWFLYLGTSGEATIIRSLGFHGVAIVLLFLTWYIFRDTRYGELIITEEAMVLISPFRSVKLPVAEVRGFRITDNYIIIEPAQKDHRKIRISIYLERQNELKEWLYGHFPNLDEAAAADEMEEILDNDRLGTFRESRFRKWQEARKTARWTNRIGWGVALWLIFYPRPYLAALSGGVLIPIIAIGLAYFYRGLMIGGDRDNSAYPTVAEAFVVPSMALLLRALFDFEILFYENAWIPIASLSVVLYCVYNFPTHGFSPRKVADYVFLIVFPLFSFAYSFGTILLVNCALDRSKPKRFETHVISKYISKGRVTSFYLTIDPWEGLEKPEEIKVTRKEYEQVIANDPVTLYQYRGFIDIPWLKVSLDSRGRPANKTPLP